MADWWNSDWMSDRTCIQTHEIDEEDWATAWKKYYHPVKISGRFTILPTWEQYDPVDSDELIIELDPGMAFGTGTHPTTVMCLQALEKYVQEGDTVVDVGTGSGVLSIGAALLGASRVHALDLDDVAVVAAKENIKLNRVDGKVDVDAWQFTGFRQRTGRYYHCEYISGSDYDVFRRCILRFYRKMDCSSSRASLVKNGI